MLSSSTSGIAAVCKQSESTSDDEALKMISSPLCADSTVCLQFLFWKESTSCKRSQSWTLHGYLQERKWCARVAAIMNASVSFTLDDLEQINFEAAANQPGRDDIFTCTCSGVCLRESGRNSCPCRSAHQFCTSRCHQSAKWNLCMNSRRVLEDDSSEEDDVSSIYFCCVDRSWTGLWFYNTRYLHFLVCVCLCL